VTDITMNSVKLYYLEILTHIPSNEWTNIHKYMRSTLVKSNSGILLTTEDAHTLTDGPTIFIAEDVEKVGKFYIQESKIPSEILDGILVKIERNNLIQKKMDVLMKSLDDTMGKESDKEKKMEKELFNPDVKKIMEKIEILRSDIKMINMEPTFIPNTIQHQRLWVLEKVIVENAFVPNIDETVVREIMELDVDNQKKVLLLLGIGVFNVSNTNIRYMEIMKRLVTEQKLFLIIASSDYIYGTNYQLCHGVLGKDLLNMTQQKTIQAIGRIGRGNIQQDYTIRFRNDNVLMRLFLPSSNNLEAENMSKLLNSPQ
jgi:hypothetical protein